MTNCMTHCVLCFDPAVELYKEPPGSPQAQRKDAQLPSLAKLEKQLAIEQRVKSAAENMIHMYSKSRQDRNRLSEAQQLQSDSRTKVEVLKMKIMKIKAGAKGQQSAGDKGLESSGNAIESGVGLDSLVNSTNRSKTGASQTPEGRINLLKYRIDVETRLMKGATSIMMAANPNDKKSGQTVSCM